MKKAEFFDPFDYTLAIKNKGQLQMLAMGDLRGGKAKAVQQSDFFETMSEATRAGKSALAELRGNRAA